MTTSREAYKIDQDHPGSDLAAETAAAMAAASIAFKPYNSSYSNLLLLHAKQLFSFADRFRGLYDDSIQCSKQFYTSSGYSDELLWAAAWLFRATNEEYYLKYVVDNAVYMGGTGWAVKEFSWDNKYAGLQILLSKVLMEGRGGAYTSTLKQYQAKADYFACACMQKNDGYNTAKTPGGLMYVREWNNLQYVSSAAFLLAVYSDYLSAANAKLTCPDALVQPQDLLYFAKSQADYILGKNPESMSYLVGYGQKYPIQVHHRGASIAAISVLQSVVTCVEGFETWYRRPEGNPNVINGGLVGGPDKNDEFLDNRSNYEQTEPTISGSAPLVGLFSKLHYFNANSGSYYKSTPAPSPTPPSTYPPKETPASPAPNTKPPGSYPKETPTPAAAPAPAPYTKPGSYPQEAPATPTPNTKSEKCPIELVHSITSTWSIGSTTYYRHKVIIKNASERPVRDIKLGIENLSGSLWGLSPNPQEKNTYELPQWLKVLNPGSECTFVYVQGGPQAKVSILSYH